MEGWIDLGYPAMHRPGFELAIFRSRVRRPTTTLPSQPSVYVWRCAVPCREWRECCTQWITAKWRSVSCESDVAIQHESSLCQSSWFCRRQSNCRQLCPGSWRPRHDICPGKDSQSPISRVRHLFAVLPVAFIQTCCSITELTKVMMLIMRQ